MLAVRTGLEPATPGVTGRYSNRLNYRTTLLFRLRTNRILRMQDNLVNTFSSKISRLHSFSSGYHFIQRLHYFLRRYCRLSPVAYARDSYHPFSSPNPDVIHEQPTHLQQHKLFSAQMLGE